MAKGFGLKDQLKELIGDTEGVRRVIVVTGIVITLVLIAILVFIILLYTKSNSIDDKKLANKIASATATAIANTQLSVAIDSIPTEVCTLYQYDVAYACGDINSTQFVAQTIPDDYNVGSYASTGTVYNPYTTTILYTISVTYDKVFGPPQASNQTYPIGSDTEGSQVIGVNVTLAATHSHQPFDCDVVRSTFNVLFPINGTANATASFYAGRFLVLTTVPLSIWGTQTMNNANNFETPSIQKIQPNVECLQETVVSS